MEKEYNNDPRLLEANQALNADIRSLNSQIIFLKELNEFLRSIINTLISK